MTPLQTSAQFAAYLWFVNQPVHADKSRADAHEFARRNWERFLPNAHEGLGRLLQEIAAPRVRRRRTDQPVAAAA